MNGGRLALLCALGLAACGSSSDPYELAPLCDARTCDLANGAAPGDLYLQVAGLDPSERGLTVSTSGSADVRGASVDHDGAVHLQLVGPGSCDVRLVDGGGAELAHAGFAVKQPDHLALAALMSAQPESVPTGYDEAWTVTPAAQLVIEEHAGADALVASEPVFLVDDPDNVVDQFASTGDVIAIAEHASIGDHGIMILDPDFSLPPRSVLVHVGQ